jgi:hypothetical protein
VGDDGEGRGQPIPRPSRPPHDDVAPESVVVELDGMAVEADVDDGELNGGVVGRGQPIPSPKSPSH